MVPGLQALLSIRSVRLIANEVSVAQSVQIKAVNWRHERLADIMISEPHLTLGEIAKKLGITLVWLSLVKNSDAFKDYWTLRSKAHSDAITIGIKEKGAAILEMSLDALVQDTQEKLEVGALTAREARENIDLISRRFGFDGSAQPNAPAPTVNLNFGLVTAEALAQARDRLRRTNPTVGESGPVVEALPLPRGEEELP